MQVAQKLSVQRVGDDAGVSKDQVRRFIRLTELIPELPDMVDERKLACNPAVEVSYLKQDEQRMLLSAPNGLMLLALAWLISPVGLPWVADRVAFGMDDLCCAVKGWMKR